MTLNKIILIVCGLAFACFADIHPGLKSAIDAGDVKTAETLVKKIGVKDLYCPASLSYKNALQIYENIFSESPEKMWYTCDSVFIVNAKVHICKTHVQLCKELLKWENIDTWGTYFKEIKESKLYEYKENHHVIEMKQERVSQGDCLRKLENEQASSGISLALLHNIFCESAEKSVASNYECMLFYKTVLDSVKKYNLKMERVCNSNKPFWPTEVSVEKKITVNPFIYELAQYEQWLSDEIKNPYSNIDRSLIALVKEMKKNTTLDLRTEKNEMKEIIDYLKNCQERNTRTRISENEVSYLRKKMFIGCSVFPKLDSALKKNHLNDFLKIFVLQKYDWDSKSVCDVFIRPSFELFTISTKKEKIIGTIIESYSQKGVISNSLKAFACRAYPKIDRDISKIAEIDILNCDDVKGFTEERDRCTRESLAFTSDNGNYVCDDGLMRTVSQEEKELKQLCLHNDIGKIKNGYGCDADGWRKLYQNESRVQKLCTKNNVGEIYADFYCDNRSGWIPHRSYTFFTDERDGKVYRVAKIKDLYWMTENLNYEYRVDGMIYENYCYKNSCDVYGRYYTRASAFDSKGIFSENSKGCDFGVKCEIGEKVRGVCPSGWRLPTYEEWKSLGRIDNPGSYNPRYNTRHLYIQGGIWKNTLENKKILPDYIDDYQYADDELGFSINPFAGLFNPEKAEWNERRDAYFWVADSSIDVIDDGIRPKNLRHNVGVNVRCVSENVFKGFGILFDSRDGKKYRTVKIGNQEWMAENLNFFNKNMKKTSWCYENKESNCDKYGRLYTWDAAMERMDEYPDNMNEKCTASDCRKKKKTQGICPDGWHLPDKAKWNNLLKRVGGKDLAGEKLKSSVDWKSIAAGDDYYGFSILPSGYYDGSKFAGLYNSSGFWTSSEKDRDYAYAAYVDGSSQVYYLDKYEYLKTVGLSVRCVKD